MKMGEVAGMVFEAGMAAYRADRRKRYSLLKPWTLPVLELELPAYDGPYIRVEPVGKRSRVTVKPYSGDVCDGASFAPDWPTGAIPAALFHDPWYLEIPAMAAAWGLDEDAVRVIGDGILSTIMLRAGGRRWVARVYYNAVFRLGGLFRRAKGWRVAGLVLVVAGLGGCSGCLAPVDWSDPKEPYTPPEWEEAGGDAVATDGNAPSNGRRRHETIGLSS